MTDPKTRRKKLYDALVKQQAFSGTEDEFNSKFSDPSRITKLYDGLVKSGGVQNSTQEEFSEKFFSDLLKKKLPTVREQVVAKINDPSAPISEDSGTPSRANAPAQSAAGSSSAAYNYNTDLKRVRQERPKKEKAEQDKRKQDLIEYYDKVGEVLDDPNEGAKLAYKNWNSVAGTMDRYQYLEQKARAEAESKRGDLKLAVSGIKQLQEDRRKAAIAGDMEEYSRLNTLLQSGVEYLRDNKAAANQNYKIDPHTETGLKIWEESVGFTSEMLNAKMENLLANPETNEKVNRLFALDEEYKKSQDPEIAKQYNELLKDDDVLQVSKIAQRSQNVLDAEKNLAVKFPHILKDRLDKKAKQDAVDTMFQAMEGTAQGIEMGIVNQVGRSATGFLADIAKLPAIIDFNNEYGWQDRWNGAVDAITDYVNDNVLPVPSDYNSPLFYQDEKGNTVFRTDLVLPKVAKTGGDMAALLFGASKISALGKAAGLSNKVSQGIGLFASSYTQTYDDYKKSGESAGMSPKDAAWFANAAAATTSALELISPNKYLWSDAKDTIAKSVAKNIAGGMSRKTAISSGVKGVLKEVLGENIQEVSQQLGDGLIETGANILGGNDYYKHNAKDVINEALETMVLTTLVAGAPAAGVSGIQYATRGENYNDAIRIVAENKDKYLPLLQQTFKEAEASPEEVKKVMDDIGAAVTPKDGTPLYMIDGQTVDRAAIQESIKNGKLNGIYVANDDALSQALTLVANKPELGKELVKTPDAVVPPAEVEKTADGKVKEEAPEDKAKRVARAKIEELVKSGDVSFDGTKNATALTDHGAQQLLLIKEEQKRSLSEPVQETKTEKKSEQKVSKKTKKASKPVLKEGSRISTSDEDTGAKLYGKVIDITDDGPRIQWDGDPDIIQYPKESVGDLTIEQETKSEPVKTVEEKKSEVKKPVSAPSPEARQRLDKVLNKVTKSLSAVAPGLKVSLYNGNEEGRGLLKDSKTKLPDDAIGFYDPETKTIGIDLSSANTSTAFHEAIHPLMTAVSELRPDLIEKLSNDAANQMIEQEDGTFVTYGEDTGGDKKEALMEFLADVADDKFDGNKTLLEKAKDFINSILEALGIKSSDFNIDLDNKESLMDFAGKIAEGLSKGKPIKFKSKNKGKSSNPGVEFQRIGKKRKIRDFEKSTGKKVNRTAKRILFDKNTKHKDISVDVYNNPDKHSFDPQKYKDIDQFLETQSDIDLFNMLDLNNSTSVLAGIKLLDRYNANNAVWEKYVEDQAKLPINQRDQNPKHHYKDPKPVFKKLREIGTSVGQLLRQFGELKTHTPNGIIKMVLGNLDSLNVTLRDQQLKDLKKMADDHVNAMADKEAKRIAYVNNPTTQTEKDLNKAEDKLAKSFNDLNTFIGNVTPLGVDSMLATVLQGNLLTSKSIVTNVLGNLVQQIPRLPELVAGDIASWMVQYLKGNDVKNPLSVFFGATFNGIKYSGMGVGSAFKDVVLGRGAENLNALEVRRNLKPWQALRQLVNKSSLPIGANGRVPASVLLEKAIEGTAGWSAEAMFRMLYLGDKPFKEGAKNAGAYRLFADSGGKTSAEFRKFMANLTPSQKKKIQDYAEEATFSNERTLAKMADKLVGALGQWVDIIAEKAPNETTQYAAKALGKTLLKANIPFVRVPSNLLQYLIELAMPPVAILGSIKYARLGDPRKSAQLFTRAMIGASMYYLANMLYDAGILIASGADDEDNERQLKQDVARPNGINMSALKRFRAGGDPTFQLNDDIRDFTKLGLLGMFFAYNAEWNESIKKELKKPRTEVSWVDQMTKALGSVSQTSLEMSFLQGSFTALDAMRKGDFTNYFSELGNTLSAIAIPNQYAATVTRPRAEYILRADDKEALKELFEKQSVKVAAHLENNITGVYPIIGMFGDPVRQTPKGENALLYHLFDITNNERIEDPMALEVYNLSKRTGEIPISVPEPKITLDLKVEEGNPATQEDDIYEKFDFNLTEQDYIYLQMIAGSYKRFDLGQEMSDTDDPWKDRTDKEKHYDIAKLNSEANADAREMILDMLYDGIDSGRIVLDKTMGTYKYTTPSEFDFDYAKKALEEN